MLQICDPIFDCPILLTLTVYIYGAHKLAFKSTYNLKYNYKVRTFKSYLIVHVLNVTVLYHVHTSCSIVLKLLSLIYLYTNILVFMKKKPYKYDQCLLGTYINVWNNKILIINILEILKTYICRLKYDVKVS